MKTLLLSAAAIAAVAIAPALAQSASTEVHIMQTQPMTRAAMVQNVQEHFAKLDTNRDGFVSKDEADKARDEMHSAMHGRIETRIADHGMDMPDRREMFDRLDTNHDGSISRDEFTSAKPQVNERKVIVIKDGKEGDTQIRMHHMGMGMRFGGHLFEMADADKDGRVSMQEATNAAAAHFDKADSNHDGTLTRDEMRAAHKGMHGRAGRR